MTQQFTPVEIGDEFPEAKAVDNINMSLMKP